MREELIFAKNCWVKKRTESLNIKDSIQFWKKYKRIFGVNQENRIGNLIDDNGILITSDQSKEKVLFEAFYTGKHLCGQPNDLQYDKEINAEYKCITDQLKQIKTNE